MGEKLSARTEQDEAIAFFGRRILDGHEVGIGRIDLEDAILRRKLDECLSVRDHLQTNDRVFIAAHNDVDLAGYSTVVFWVVTVGQLLALTAGTHF
ncbi:MAG: hypothetical protein ACREEM_15520 [Blastocatellia bacterium]